MKAISARTIGFLFVSLSLAACSQGRGSFGGSGSSGGGGGGAGGAGGGGGGGGGTVTNSPRLVYELQDQGAALFNLKLSGDGGRVVFVSNEDPFGTNIDEGEQIFSIDVATSTLVQLTTEPETAFAAFMDFDITDNGDRVVFTTREDITGDNPTNTSNIFVANTNGSGVVQVTDFTSGFVTDPEISGNGSVIVFTSRSDPTGGNPSNVDQIFAINSDGTNLTQVTTGSQSPDNLAFSDNGQVIAFESTQDPFGTNGDNTREIFVINIDGTGHMQLTNTDGFSFNPKISDDGQRVVFASRAEHIAGGNADGNYEVYMATSDGTSLVQLTNTDRDSGVFNSGAPGNLDISGNGQWVAFGSSGDHTGDNTDNQRTLFWVNAGGTETGQFLRDGRVPAGVRSRTADNVHMTNDGSGVLFDSDSNYSPEASGGGEKLYTHTRQ